MHLKIRVSDAAYVDKHTSDTIMYELVPRYDLEEALPASSSNPTWLTSSCVRQSEQLEALHQHLRRKHPHLLFPPFPLATRKSHGWGSESFLQSMRRRFERYFSRLLMRSELQEELAVLDFMSEKGHGKKEKRGSVWESLPLSRWFSTGPPARLPPEDKIIKYTIKNLSLPEEVKMQESLDKVIQVRQDALCAVTGTLEAMIEAIQRYNIAMGQVSKSIQDVTSAHVRHLITDHDNGFDRSSLPKTFQDDVRANERRFRELGDRFVDLVNQMQPGFSSMRKVLNETILEVAAGQLRELDNVRQYINKEILALQRYDEQAGKRQEVLTRRRSIMDSYLEARLNAAMADAQSDEEIYKSEYETKSKYLQSEMQIYWEQTSNEFFSAVSQSMKVGLDMTRVNVDALKAWFPPTEL